VKKVHLSQVDISGGGPDKNIQFCPITPLYDNIMYQKLGVSDLIGSTFIINTKLYLQINICKTTDKREFTVYT
jgi:hypothetical protein